ncbi:MAG: hypothetical protein R1F52_03530 [Candidatus Nitrosoabyssus spongiisocia]|nr:MAG: hypothetical protein R1F52_03530 [Nitrosopumilaceae archaeon AB1(1)]
MEHQFGELILIISTIVLAGVGILTFLHNRQLYEIIKEERNDNLTPLLVCKIITEDQKSTASTSAHFIIHNQGKGIAYNINVKLTSEKAIIKGKTEFEEIVSAIGPNGIYQINLGLIIEQENDTVDFNFEYENNNRYEILEANGTVSFSSYYG